MAEVKVWINGQECAAEEGESMLKVALRNGIEIPHFCYHEDLTIEASCRACLVEVEGKENTITTSCTLKAKEGLHVRSETAKVKKLRTENMELLLADHRKYCESCKNGYPCKVVEKMEKFGVTGTKYQKEPVQDQIDKMGTAAEIEPALCIGCNKCVEMCRKIGICHLKLEGKNHLMHVARNETNDCVYCGQCTVHCPVAAVREQTHLPQVEAALSDPEKIVIVQTAPSVRTSIGEEFGAEVGRNMTGELATAYRKVGFDYVMDVNMGADITTLVEAEELIERIKKNEGLPMFTSCCPGWVKYVEFYQPWLMPHLTTARSPQMHSGGAYKTWWAKKMGIDPKKLVVVSTMPCTSKKYEAHNDKFNIDGMRPVDWVLTTRELATLFKKHGIDLTKLEKGELDHDGLYSGAAAIYGASGGVMESALRTAYFDLTGEEMPKLEFEAVRGMQGIKKAEVQVGERTLKLAVVATMKNVAMIVGELKKNPGAYDYIEVMACPGGCIGGGGQPIPSTEKIITERIASLYKHDEELPIRQAHKNPVALEFMEYVKTLPHEEQAALLHTHYSQKKRGE